MKNSWVKVYTTPIWYKAELMKHLLEEENLDVIKLNKRDSSYLNFGEIELYVPGIDFNKAIEVIIQSE
ncbi:DUF2007 domain-containing protein [Solitalea koreensis]|uniref:Signal transducing protein n=1 Tax=Solitalea koreensis TaxID=543615 RepID=A0A521C390_9SPHI|nr:DUF2007 domain-containing protein [Solitalea koreensis]SMO53200.1 Putative signal transducing protein [Solitalea koreensis]